MSENLNTPRPRGKQKIFLGFASGVGKTFAMLDEAHRRRRRGQEVVVGIVDSRGRQAVVDDVGDLEIIPTKTIEANGKIVREMDTEAVLKRGPDLVLVDDLDHEIADGTPRHMRWQDVERLMDAGINVLSTVNVQHLESLNDSIADITSLRELRTVPDQVFHDAEEIELVDCTPRALINRLERGDVFPLDEITDEVKNFYREGNLTALREMAMREAAGVVDEDLVEYRKIKRIERPWATQDRIMVCISPTRSSLRILRRGWRIGQRLHGEVLAVHVEDGSSSSEKARKLLKDDFALAERLGIKTFTLKGDLAEQLIKFAQERNVTQILLGHPERSRIQEMLKPSILSELARELRTVDIIVVATEQVPHPEHH